MAICLQKLVWLYVCEKSDGYMFVKTRMVICLHNYDGYMFAKTSMVICLRKV